ncbi:MAG: AraC family transcriptional regulator, partial [Bacteroidetes bacterium]|nr:AraC family transcriptional regulator [Bacteroidota bacterium]
DMLHLTYATCLRKVKDITGMTINEYIRHIRIHRASLLLKKHPDQTILSIAVDVGFTSAAHFSREFKKVINKTPSDYRKSQLTS